MPDLRRAYGGPVEALIGFAAASGPEAILTVVGPSTDAAETAWLAAQMPGADLTTASRFAVPGLVGRLASAADVVHVHGLLNAVSSLGAGAALARDRPVVIGPFGTMSRYTFTHRRALAKRLYFRALDAPHLRRAAAVHFTTPAERDEAAWHGLDLGDRAHVVPPPFRGRPVERGSGPPRDTAGRDAGSGPTVLFLGRLHPKKGLELLLEAWPAVRRVHPAARLVIAGSGTARYVAGLEAAAAATGASVTFAGFVAGDAKRAMLADADLFVLPSHHENFGIAVLEAVAAGVPVVVSQGVQLAPWIASRSVGHVAAREPDALASAITATLGDAGLGARVSACGATMVADDFGPARVGPALLAMYRDARARAGGG